MNLTEAELHVSISWLWVLFLGKDFHVSKSSCWVFSWSKEGRTFPQCSPRNWWGWPEQLKVHDRNPFDVLIYPLNAAVEFGPKSWESMRMFLFLICQKSPVGILGPWSHWVLGSAWFKRGRLTLNFFTTYRLYLSFFAFFFFWMPSLLRISRS